MMTRGSRSQKGLDNPQMARLKQHFEKKNKRHTSELEHLQRKLASYEHRLAEIESGVSESGAKTTVMRTGANLKGMTETVMAAPLELAQRIKSTFGSADSVNNPTEGAVVFALLHPKARRHVVLKIQQAAALKQEQKGIANRLDYQYNDRFKRVEESVESVENHMVRMENSIKDTLDIRLSSPAWSNAVFLSSANIVVEFLKIVLYLVATILDLFLPFFGSRLVHVFHLIFRGTFCFCC
ncbi:unnamed protein product [Angiostrongylus costaricensis]|uniref:BAR domain-containing protein n=1 Tax=Angiostrongylus costaricensis TaxID=334426 RepID=A0A0R3PL79_ANGCS|nr:unnamed protein product [Angiostrongylus costaricensis]